MSSRPATNEDAQAMFRTTGEEWLGNFGEAIWGNILRASGWYLVPLSKIEDNGAPLARGSGGALILPDFDVYRDSRAVFVEAKAKTQSIVFRQKRSERHGINQRNYEHYRQIERESGKQCCIAVVELWRENRDRPGQLYWSGGLLIERLVDLLDPRSEHPENPPKVYWPRKQFRELNAGLTPLELFALARGELPVDYGMELESIFHPHHQMALF